MNSRLEYPFELGAMDVMRGNFTLESLKPL